MGINVNMDYSTLFSSMSAGSSSNNYFSNLTGMLSDYSSIKNGSYGKLVSAYYKKVGNDNVSSSDDDSSSKKAETSTAKSAAAEKKQYTALASDAKSLGANADKLSADKSSLFEKSWQVTGEDGEASKIFDYDSSRIMNAVSSFVKDYNSIISTASDISDVTTDARVSYMGKLTSSYKNELSSIGITVKDNGKLSINKDKLKESGMESVKNVFGGKSGYAYQISSAASLLESSATKAASKPSTYSSKGALNADYSSIMDSFI